MAEMSDKELLKALGVEAKVDAKSTRTAREERIIAGFEDIERFFEQQGRLPAHDEDKEIFERLYAVRLDKIRASWVVHFAPEQVVHIAPDLLVHFSPEYLVHFTADYSIPSSSESMPQVMKYLAISQAVIFF